MRAVVTLLLIGTVACGDDGNTPLDGNVDVGPDGTDLCQPQGATGQFIRRAGNPQLLPHQTFTDGKLDTEISDPDVRWTGQRWDVFYGTGHTTSYTSSDKIAVIRRASTIDRMTWTIEDEPALTQSSDPGAWDHALVAAPTVIENPSAPPDRRYLMLYAGSDGTFPYMGYSRQNFQIGAAFSADGVTFTRITAEQSPHDKPGLVLTGRQVYPTATNGIVADPDVVLVGGVYHLFFSSYACAGPQCQTVENNGIAHATSADGITWTIVEAPVRSLLRASADPKSGGAQPSVIYDEARCRWEIWLSNDLPVEISAQTINVTVTAGVWHSSSTNGNAWDSINYAFARELAWSASEPGEGLGMQAGIEVGNNGSGRLMLFTGLDDENIPVGFTLPLRVGGTTPGVRTLGVATRDLP
ncbi:MAG: hypothetical protein SFX73_14920 [Kofleriaceae bacterium]|nr:hypothetical protein [Kofleriaceae bacterium]